MKFNYTFHYFRHTMITTDIYNLTRLDVVNAFNQEVEITDDKERKIYEITSPVGSEDNRILQAVGRANYQIIQPEYVNSHFYSTRYQYLLTCQQFVSVVFRLLAYSQKHSTEYADNCYLLASDMLETIGIELV